MRARLNRNGRCNIASSLAVQQPRLPLPGDVPPFVGSKPLRPSIVEGVWHTRIKVTFGESGAVVEQPTANVNGIVCMSASRVHARTPDSSRLREKESARGRGCNPFTLSPSHQCILHTLHRHLFKSTHFVGCAAKASPIPFRFYTHTKESSYESYESYESYVPLKIRVL